MRNFIFMIGSGLVGLAVVLGAPACSDENACVASFSDVGGPEAPCVLPAAGAAPQCFEQAQICPDLSPIAFCTRTVNSTVAVNVLVNNRGELPMKITSIKVRGDTRCAFKRAQFAPAVGSTIEAGGSMVLRFQYVGPAQPGEDHAVIEVTSDAENFPILPVAVCGKTVAPGQGGGGMCLECQDRRTAEYTDCFEMD